MLGLVKRGLFKMNLGGVWDEGGKAWRHYRWRRQRRRGRVDERLLADYVARHAVHKLNIGCCSTLLPGWLNGDLEPISDAVFELSAVSLPFADASFDRVFSEHMIEHVPFADGARMLAECHRVLRPGGRIRLSTPDLAFLVKLYTDPIDGPAKDYVDWAIDMFTPAVPSKDPIFVLNNAVRDWGHVFIYDRATLRAALERAGFVEIVECEVGESPCPEMRGIDNDGRMPPGFYAMETFILEAAKPDDGR